MGVDLSGELDPGPLARFITGLGGAPQVRRLCLDVPTGGDRAAAALADLIPTLPRLVEVSADCLGAGRVDVFWQLWGAIARHAGVRANDQPVKTPPPPPESESQRAVLAKIAGRTPPATVEQREDFMASCVTRGPRLTDETELFEVATTLPPSSGRDQKPPEAPAADASEYSYSGETEAPKVPEKPKPHKRAQSPPPAFLAHALKKPNCGGSVVPGEARGRSGSVGGVEGLEEPPKKRRREPQREGPEGGAKQSREAR
jgi:hypothetical protein